MERLNYQHLYYFWHVAKEGGISRACEKLHLAQPTVSGQLAIFEDAIGEKLFYRDGRTMTLTDTGRTVFHYADEIFTLGRELTNTLKGRAGGRTVRLSVGVADAMPKLITYRLLEPALRLPEPVQLMCYEDKSERLLGEIALHSLDLVLSDVPATPATGSRIFNHFLGESGVAVFGAPSLAARYSQNFPRSLDRAPFLLPTPSTELRRSLDQWFDAEHLSPIIQAEIEDSALLKTFAGAGIGLFVAPTVVETEIRQRYGAVVVGHIDSVRERFYAISAQRKVQHIGVAAILANAKARVFDSRERDTTP